MNTNCCHKKKEKMKIAVVSEVSARDKNPYIMEALKQTGNEVFNIGMEEGNFDLELTYIHTGLMAATLLNLGAVDIVVGGCGTGEGFMISAMQYPEVFCGLISEPLDAFLFGQINGGNCISLALNKGFGWAGDISLKYIFEKLFTSDFGKGYPKTREESQQKSRKMLCEISKCTHKDFKDILAIIDSDILSAVMKSEKFKKMILGECKNKVLQKFIIEKFLNE